MMKKPVMKRKLAITNLVPSMRIVSFYADKDTADSLKEFGKVFSNTEEDLRDSHELYVDPRFDFEDVVEYMESMNNDKQDGE